jgi:hypothetical protein
MTSLLADRSCWLVSVWSGCVGRQFKTAGFLMADLTFIPESVWGCAGFLRDEKRLARVILEVYGNAKIDFVSSGDIDADRYLGCWGHAGHHRELEF